MRAIAAPIRSQHRGHEALEDRYCYGLAKSRDIFVVRTRFDGTGL